MKKWLLASFAAVLGLLAVTVFLAPFGIGFLVERTYPQMLAALSQSGDVQLKLVHYQRSWFHSQAQIEVRVAHADLLKLSDWVASNNQAALTFVITQTIEHGPWLMVAPRSGKSHLFFGQAMIKSHVNPEIGDIDAMTLVKINGAILSVISAPHIQYRDDNQHVRAEVSGLTATFNLSSDLKSLRGKIQAPDIIMQTETFQQLLHGVTADYQLSTSPSGLLLGSRLTQMKRVVWEADDQDAQIIAVDGLALQSKSEERDGRVDYEMKALIHEITLNENSYGPQQLDIAINHIDVPTLLTLKRELAQINDAEHLSSLQLIKYNELFMMLLGKGLEMDIQKCNLVTPWGVASVNGRVLLKPQATLAMNLDTFLSYVEAKLHVQIPGPVLVQTLAKLDQTALGKEMGLVDADHIAEATDTDAYFRQQVKDKIAGWVEKNLLVAQGDTYLFDLLFQHDKAIINGKPYKQDTALDPALSSSETS